MNKGHKRTGLCQPTTHKNSTLVTISPDNMECYKAIHIPTKSHAPPASIH